MINVFDVYGVEAKILYEYINADNEMVYHDSIIKLVQAYYTGKIKKVYPQITPEKILKLEEVVLNRHWDIHYEKNALNGWRIGCYEIECGNYDFKSDVCDTRLESLSSLLIKLYDHFTEQEREQVKRILEGK